MTKDKNIKHCKEEVQGNERIKLKIKFVKSKGFITVNSVTSDLPCNSQLKTTGTQCRISGTKADHPCLKAKKKCKVSKEKASSTPTTCQEEYLAPELCLKHPAPYPKMLFSKQFAGMIDQAIGSSLQTEQLQMMAERACSYTEDQDCNVVANTSHIQSQQMSSALNCFQSKSFLGEQTLKRKNRNVALEIYPVIPSESVTGTNDFRHLDEGMLSDVVSPSCMSTVSRHHHSTGSGDRQNIKHEAEDSLRDGKKCSSSKPRSASRKKRITTLSCSQSKSSSSSEDSFKNISKSRSCKSIPTSRKKKTATLKHVKISSETDSSPETDLAIHENCHLGNPGPSCREEGRELLLTKYNWTKCSEGESMQNSNDTTSNSQSCANLTGYLNSDSEEASSSMTSPLGPRGPASVLSSENHFLLDHSYCKMPWVGISFSELNHSMADLSHIPNISLETDDNSCDHNNGKLGKAVFPVFSQDSTSSSPARVILSNSAGINYSLKERNVERVKSSNKVKYHHVHMTEKALTHRSQSCFNSFKPCFVVLERFQNVSNKAFDQRPTCSRYCREECIDFLCEIGKVPNCKHFMRTQQSFERKAKQSSSLLKVASIKQNKNVDGSEENKSDCLQKINECLVHNFGGHHKVSASSLGAFLPLNPLCDNKSTHLQMHNNNISIKLVSSKKCDLKHIEESEPLSKKIKLTSECSKIECTATLKPEMEVRKACVLTSQQSLISKQFSVMNNTAQNNVDMFKSAIAKRGKQSLSLPSTESYKRCSTDFKTEGKGLTLSKVNIKYYVFEASNRAFLVPLIRSACSNEIMETLDEEDLGYVKNVVSELLSEKTSCARQSTYADYLDYKWLFYTVEQIVRMKLASGGDKILESLTNIGSLDLDGLQAIITSKCFLTLLPTLFRKNPVEYLQQVSQKIQKYIKIGGEESTDWINQMAADIVSSQKRKLRTKLKPSKDVTIEIDVANDEFLDVGISDVSADNPSGMYIESVSYLAFEPYARSSETEPLEQNGTESAAFGFNCEVPDSIESLQPTGSHVCAEAYSQETKPLLGEIIGASFFCAFDAQEIPVPGQHVNIPLPLDCDLGQKSVAYINAQSSNSCLLEQLGHQEDSLPGDRNMLSSVHGLEMDTWCEQKSLLQKSVQFLTSPLQKDHGEQQNRENIHIELQPWSYALIKQETKDNDHLDSSAGHIEEHQPEHQISETFESSLPCISSVCFGENAARIVNMAESSQLQQIGVQDHCINEKSNNVQAYQEAFLLKNHSDYSTDLRSGNVLLLTALDEKVKDVGSLPELKTGQKCVVGLSVNCHNSSEISYSRDAKGHPLDLLQAGEHLEESGIGERLMLAQKDNVHKHISVPLITPRDSTHASEAVFSSNPLMIPSGQLSGLDTMTSTLIIKQEPVEPEPEETLNSSFYLSGQHFTYHCDTIINSGDGTAEHKDIADVNALGESAYSSIVSTFINPISDNFGIDSEAKNNVDTNNFRAFQDTDSRAHPNDLVQCDGILTVKSFESLNTKSFIHDNHFKSLSNLNNAPQNSVCEVPVNSQKRTTCGSSVDCQSIYKNLRKPPQDLHADKLAKTRTELSSSKTSITSHFKSLHKCRSWHSQKFVKQVVNSKAKYFPLFKNCYSKWHVDSLSRKATKHGMHTLLTPKLFFLTHYKSIYSKYRKRFSSRHAYKLAKQSTSLRNVYFPLAAKKQISGISKYRKDYSRLRASRLAKIAAEVSSTNSVLAANCVFSVNISQASNDAMFIPKDCASDCSLQLSNPEAPYSIFTPVIPCSDNCSAVASTKCAISTRSSRAKMKRTHSTKETDLFTAPSPAKRTCNVTQPGKEASEFISIKKKPELHTPVLGERPSMSASLLSFFSHFTPQISAEIHSDDLVNNNLKTNISVKVMPENESKPGQECEQPKQRLSERSFFDCLPHDFQEAWKN